MNRVVQNSKHVVRAWKAPLAFEDRVSLCEFRVCEQQFSSGFRRSSWVTSLIRDGCDGINE